MNDVVTLPNFDLRDEIRAYWSARAATFDQQPGHEIFSMNERVAWHNLIRKHLGEGDGRLALDLASGTGVVSHLLDDLGFRVTGMDWSEAMLERARSKAKSRGRNIRFLLGDAENTLEADETYEVITNRHLVWTLVDPEAAFMEWHRLLKPGGKLLVVDGDFVKMSMISRLVKRFLRLATALKISPRTASETLSGDMAETHAHILSRVYFSGGARSEAVADLLRKAGFSNVIVDGDMRAIRRAQRKNFNFFKRLERATQHRYAICATK